MGLTLASCRGDKHPLKIYADCKSPEVIHCLQEYSYDNMSDADIERLVVEGIDHCFSKNIDERGTQALSCLPLRVGTDRNKRPLELIFRCEDACRKNGHIWLRYADAPPLEECCARGGMTIRAWAANGHYSGCGLPIYYDVFKDMEDDLEKYSLCKDHE